MMSHLCVCVCTLIDFMCVCITQLLRSDIHCLFECYDRILSGCARRWDVYMYRRSRFGDLNAVRVREGPSGMTAGGGACSDGPSLACLRVEARFFCYVYLNDFTIVALVKIF